MTWSLIRALETSDRFRRDSPLGGIFHPGLHSYREVTPRDSLHIVIDGNRVSAHVDEVCPLRCESGTASGYSWVRVVAHNAVGFVADLSRRLRGKHGKQRCNLGCEMVWFDDRITDFTADLGAATSSRTGCGSEGRP